MSPSTIRTAAFAFLVLTATTARAATTDVSSSGFTPLFLGVDQEQASIDGSHAHVVRVDLRMPGIRFAATAQSGPQQTTSTPLSAFVAERHLRIAINANFFSPCCSTTPQPQTLLGLEVDQGRLVSPPSYTPGNFNAVLTLTRDNHARILEATGPADLDLPRIYTAVAGSGVIVKGGVNVAPGDAQGLDAANPRTVVGLSADRRFLYLVTIDGRVAGYSPGTTMSQTADLMVALGCDTALNLDGGGSTEMVTRQPGAAPYIVNNPSGGRERLDGSAIGLTAIALPDPAALAGFGLLQHLQNLGLPEETP